MKIQQKRGAQILTAIALIAATIWGIESASTQVLTAHHAMPENPLSVSPGPGAVLEGKRLAHVDGCFGCHGAQLTGQVVFSGWFGTQIVAPNLTRLAHRQTGAQLATAIRYGINHDRASVIDMPSNQFIKSSDGDIAALIAYLRSLPEKPDTAGDTRLRLDGRALVVMGLLPLEAGLVDKSTRGPLRTPSSPLALGRYITQAHCSVCHGADLSGKTIEGSPDLRFSIEHYSPSAFENFFQTGEGQIGHGTRIMTRMIRSRFQYLTPVEVHAICVYLKKRRAARRIAASGRIRPPVHELGHF
jgi:mono/diheme cytochrome c family protein